VTKIKKRKQRFFTSMVVQKRYTEYSIYRNFKPANTIPYDTLYWSVAAKGWIKYSTVYRHNSTPKKHIVQEMSYGLQIMC